MYVYFFVFVGAVYLGKIFVYYINGKNSQTKQEKNYASCEK